jgi:LCP family protein required for cell wall assembly
MGMDSKRRAGALVAVAAVVVAAACSDQSARARDLHVGRRPRPATSAPTTSTIVVEPTTTTADPPAGAVPGDPYGRPLVFRSAIPVPFGLTFVLVVGSDARPGHDPRTGNADSIHLVAVNPETRRGTVLGIPRDAWVEVPGHGNRKITTALATGGPDLLARTVEHLTGLPVDYYAVTGFAGLKAMVDELGGLDIHVDEPMSDPYSGARFGRGWHHMDGGAVLAFARNRHGVAGGDFTRSLNQGKVLLAALAKMRAEVADDGGIDRWVGVLVRHAVLDTGLGTLRGLAALARRLDPAGLRNEVLPGRVGWGPGGQSVVYLDPSAAAIFEDLRPDATLG